MTTPTPPTGHEPAIVARGLRRSYGRGAQSFEAVRGLDLEVEHGTVTALLGTNGAGKTSTLEVLEGLAPAASGEVRVLGLDPLAARRRIRSRIGILLQESGFSADLTVRETLDTWRSTVTEPLPTADLLGALGLDDRSEVRIRGLSGGERRRLDLACTLSGSPDVLFLDEPSTGLDPESRRSVWDLVRSRRDAGVTVLLTTHYLDEAEALADRLAIMHQGQVRVAGTAAEITAGGPSSISFDTPVDAPALPGLGGAEVSVDEGTTSIRTEDLQGVLTVLLAWAEGAGVRLQRLQAKSASLESVFLDLAAGTGASGEDAR